MKAIIKSFSLIAAGLLLQAGATAQSFTNLKHFSGTNGSVPTGPLVLSGSTLYGTTGLGGSSNKGTIYKINTDGSDFMVLKHFAGTNDGVFPESGVVLSGSTVYGTAFDVIFKLDTNGGGFTVLKTFPANTSPRGLMISGSTLFGVTTSGAPGTTQMVYRINTDGSGFTNLHTFNDTTDGAAPYGAPVLSGNTLYGTAVFGGALNFGSVYRVNTDGSGFTNLHSFNGSDGAKPYAPLVLSGGTLFGTTAEGGLGAGTIFRIDTDGSGFTNFYNFDGDGGGFPYAGLTLNGSTLYGVAQLGGSAGFGTAFKINSDGSGFTVLRHFSGTSDGSSPGAETVFAADTLYGTTASGGSSNAGTVFTLSLSPPSPPSITTPPQNQYVFPGENATFTVVAGGSSPLTYQWRFYGTNLASATDSSFTRSNVQSNDFGSYNVVVTNNLGSITSAVATLAYFLNPILTNQQLGGGIFTFTLNANPPARNYLIQQTTNIPDWSNVLTFSNISGPVVFTETNADVFFKVFRAKTAP